MLIIKTDIDIISLKLISNNYSFTNCNYYYCLIAKADAEILRKKKCVEYQQIQENKLSLAQINGRLSQLKCRRDELEGEKRSLLKQSNKIKLNWYL